MNNDTNETKCREEFESMRLPEELEKDEIGGYKNREVHCMWIGYYFACKKRHEEQRLKNEKALEALETMSSIVPRLLLPEGRAKFNKDIETIKAALG